MSQYGRQHRGSTPSSSQETTSPTTTHDRIQQRDAIDSTKKTTDTHLPTTLDVIKQQTTNTTNDLYYNVMAPFHRTTANELREQYANQILYNPDNINTLKTILKDIILSKHDLSQIEQDRQQIVQELLTNHPCRQGTIHSHFRTRLTHKLILEKTNGLSAELKKTREQSIIELIRWDTNTPNAKWEEGGNQQTSKKTRTFVVEQLLRDGRPGPDGGQEWAQAYDFLVNRVMEGKEQISWEGREYAHAYLLDNEEEALSSETLKAQRQKAIKDLFLMPREKMRDPEQEKHFQETWDPRYQIWRDKYRQKTIGETFPDDPTLATDIQMEYLFLADEDTNYLSAGRRNNLIPIYSKYIIEQDKSALQPDLQDLRTQIIDQITLTQTVGTTAIDTHTQDLVISAFFRDNDPERKQSRFNKAWEILNKNVQGLTPGENLQQQMVLEYLLGNSHDDTSQQNLEVESLQNRARRRLLQHTPDTLSDGLKEIQTNVVNDLIFHPREELKSERLTLINMFEARAMSESLGKNDNRLPETFQSTYEKLSFHLLDRKVKYDNHLVALRQLFQIIRTKPLKEQGRSIRKETTISDITIKRDLFQTLYTTKIQGPIKKDGFSLWNIELHTNNTGELPTNDPGRDLYHFEVIPDKGTIRVYQHISTDRNQELSLPQVIRNSVQDIQDKYTQETGNSINFMLKNIEIFHFDASITKAINPLTPNELPAHRKLTSQDDIDTLLGAESLQDYIHLGHYFPEVSLSNDHIVSIPASAQTSIRAISNLTYSIAKQEKYEYYDSPSLQYSLTISYELPDNSIRELLQRDPETLTPNLKEIQQTTIRNLVFYPQKKIGFQPEIVTDHQWYQERQNIIDRLENKTRSQYMGSNDYPLPSAYQATYEYLPLYLLDIKGKVDAQMEPLRDLFWTLRRDGLKEQGQSIRENPLQFNIDMQRHLFQNKYKTTITGKRIDKDTVFYTVEVRTNDTNEFRYRFGIVPEAGVIQVYQRLTNDENNELSFPQIIRNSVQDVFEKRHKKLGVPIDFTLEDIEIFHFDPSIVKAINTLTSNTLPAGRELSSQEDIDTLLGAKSLQDYIHIGKYFPERNSSPHEFVTPVPNLAKIAIKVKDPSSYDMIKNGKYVSYANLPFQYTLLLSYTLPKDSEEETESHLSKDDEHTHQKLTEQ